MEKTAYYRSSHHFKLLLLGEGGVGKTSLVLRFVEDRFNESYKQSLGADFMSKTVNLSTKDGNSEATINLQIWDIAGAAKFSSFTKLYCSGVNGVFFVYDITRRVTLSKLSTWNDFIKTYSPDAAKCLIGNKVDLTEQIEVFLEDKRTWEKNIGSFCSLETSAKTGDGVEKAFNAISRIMYERNP